MGRGGWLLLGGCACVVAVAAGGYAVTRGDSYDCANAVPEADVMEAGLPIYAGGDDATQAIIQAAEQELGDVRGRSAPLNEDETRFIEVGIDALHRPPAGWTGPTSVLVDLDDPRLELVDDVVLADSDLLGETRGGPAGGRTYVVVDSASGALRWARDQQGHSAGGAPIGDSWMLVQSEIGRRPTVATLDPTNGQLQSCTTVGETSGVELELSAWPVEGGVVVAEGAETSVQLARVAASNTEVSWQQRLDGLSKVGSLTAAGDTLVAADTANNTEARAGAATRPGSQVHALDAQAGGLRWTWQAESDDGTGSSHTVVGATEDVVVVAADRLVDETVQTGQVVATQLAVLNATDGQPVWTLDVPNTANTSAADVRLFNDVVVTSEISPGEGNARVVELVGRDVDSGDELWRIPHRATALRDADINPATEQLLLPTRSLDGNGMEIVDLHTGQTSRAFEGVALARVDVDDTAVAVTAYFGPVSSGVLLIYEIAA